MLDKFKSQKYLLHMAVGEEAYLSIFWGIVFDENGIPWLNLDSLVSSKYGGILSVKVKRIGDGCTTSDFDVDLSSSDITFCEGASHLLKRNPGYICLEEDYYLSSAAKQIADQIIAQGESSGSKKNILEPLFKIFLNSKTMNNVLIQTSIPEIIRGEQPIFQGVILFGEGGTGKTAIQRAIAEVYRRAGAFSVELNVASLTEKYVGSLGHNLDKEIGEAIKKSEKMGVPIFIFLDEATSLIISSGAHNSSGCDYYQEAVDVLKKYISNYSNIVFGITTNAKPDMLDDTLIRDGRLAPIELLAPGTEELEEMWKFYITKYEILELQDCNYQELAKKTIGEKGSFVANFCRCYLSKKKLMMETSAVGSGRLLDALIADKFISMNQVKESVTFQSFLQDIKEAIEDREFNKNPDKFKKKPGFFC